MANISVPKSIDLEIDAEKCKGCGLCVDACLKGVIIMSASWNRAGYHYAAVERKESCSGCGSCYLMCPDVCITIYRDDQK